MHRVSDAASTENSAGGAQIVLASNVHLIHKDIMKLSAWMDREGLDDQAMAQRVNKDRSTIYRIRTGSHKPSPELMHEIARKTGGEVLPNDYFDDLPVAA